MANGECELLIKTSSSWKCITQTNLSF